MKGIRIRQETTADGPVVHEIVRLAFAQAEYSDHDEHNLVIRLRRSADFMPELSLVAEYGGRAVGHALFSRIKIHDGARAFDSLALAPVSVLPELQGRGIGSRLVMAGHAAARELGFGSVIVVGHPAYYPRFGYVPASRFGISAPFDIPDDSFMACELAPGALSGVRGCVEYPAEFLLG